jgi:hypothetical protein
VGAPHLGAQTAVGVQQFCPPNSPLPLCVFIRTAFGVDPNSTAISELRPDREAIQMLNDLTTNPLPTSVEYVSIVGTGTPIFGTIGQDGDGLVNVTEQNLANVPGSESLNHMAIMAPIQDRSSCDPAFEPDPVTGADLNPAPNLTHTCEPTDMLVWGELLQLLLTTPTSAN